MRYAEWVQRVYEEIRAREQALPAEHRSQGQPIMTLAEAPGVQNDDSQEVAQAIKCAVEDIERLGLVQLLWGNNDGATLTQKGSVAAIDTRPRVQSPHA